MLSEADRNQFRAHESHSSGARVTSGALSQSFRLELPVNTTLKAWVSFLCDSEGWTQRITRVKLALCHWVATTCFPPSLLFRKRVSLSPPQPQAHYNIHLKFSLNSLRRPGWSWTPILLQPPAKLGLEHLSQFRIFPVLFLVFFQASRGTLLQQLCLTEGPSCSPLLLGYHISSVA